MPAEFSRYGTIDLSKQIQEAGAEVEERQGDIAVITGISGLTGLGDGDLTWEGALAGRSAVRAMDVMIGGERVSMVASPVDFNPLLYFDRKTVRRIPMPSLMAMYLAKEAAKSAGILDINGEKLSSEFNPDHVGTTLTTAMGPSSGIVDVAEALTRGVNKLGPTVGLESFQGQLAGHVATYLGLSGWGEEDKEACATGASSIVEAALLVQTGKNDMVVAGGVEDIFNNYYEPAAEGEDEEHARARILRSHNELGPGIFSSMRAYSVDRVDQPQTASRPFDRDRKGIVMGSGGAAFVVESLRHAEARGAKIYATILASAKGMDGKSPVLSDPDRIARLIWEMLKIPGKENGYWPVDAIFAHATSTPDGDPLEIKALRIAFGEALRQIPITAPKSLLGHLLGGAGAVNALLAIKAIESGIIPPTINLENSDFPDLRIITEATKAELRTAMVAAYGMGGHDALLLFGNPKFGLVSSLA